MKEAAPSHINNYFQVWHGKQSWLMDMPRETHVVIQQALESGEAIGEYPLPGFRPPGDMRISMPQRVREREAFKEKQLQKVRDELAHLP